MEAQTTYMEWIFYAYLVIELFVGLIFLVIGLAYTVKKEVGGEEAEPSEENLSCSKKQPY